MAPYKEIEAFIEQVHSVYPEVNIEVVPYSGDNTTTCLQNMFAAGDLPDVCTLTYYDPQIDLVSDKLLDLSGYDFTDNYVESRLQDVFDNGAIYLLPSTYNCYGITYNKTLLKKYGWELPNSFAELEVLAAKAKEAGVDLCLPQIQYPGYGFQYLCNIADADFLGTLDGRLWQRDYLSGKANVSNTPGMMQAMAYVQKWKDIGMLNGSGDALDDNVTRQRMAEGNTLFLIGNTNGIVEADGNADQFGLMPYLSEDGTQNVFVLNVNRFYGLNKKLEQRPPEAGRRAQGDACAFHRCRHQRSAARNGAEKQPAALQGRKGGRHLLCRHRRCPERRQHRALYLFRLGKHHRDHRP